MCMCMCCRLLDLPACFMSFMRFVARWGTFGSGRQTLSEAGRSGGRVFVSIHFSNSTQHWMHIAAYRYNVFITCSSILFFFTRIGVLVDLLPTTWGSINIPGPRKTTGNFCVLVVSSVVILCKGPFDQPPYLQIDPYQNKKQAL